MLTCGELLVKLLEDFGVDIVFGIPGVHTVELYRGLPATRIRHVTPRHEQGAQSGEALVRHYAGDDSAASQMVSEDAER